MRLINADDVIRQLDEWIDPAIQATKWFINSAPTIDAVQVVRCKDCKFRFVGETMYSSGLKQSVVTRWDCYRTEDNKDTDFCSYGEKNEANTE